MRRTEEDISQIDADLKELAKIKKAGEWTIEDQEDEHDLTRDSWTARYAIPKMMSRAISLINVRNEFKRQEFA